MCYKEIKQYTHTQNCQNTCAEICKKIQIDFDYPHLFVVYLLPPFDWSEDSDD